MQKLIMQEREDKSIARPLNKQGRLGFHAQVD